MKTLFYKLRNLLLLISITFLFAVKCSTSSKPKAKPTIQKPIPVMEPQVDSLKKVLDEKRKNKTNVK